MAEPSVLLADEPFVGLDAATLEVVTETLEAHASRGIVVLADHGDTMLGRQNQAVQLENGRVIL